MDHTCPAGGHVVNIASELQSVVRLLTLPSSAWRAGETMLVHAVVFLHQDCMWKSESLVFEHTFGLHVIRAHCTVAETQTEAAPQLLLRSVTDASYFAVAVLGRSRE